MSFILEALRKSENDRQRLGSVALADLPVARRRSGQPWWVFALGALLLVNLVVLAVVLMRDKPAPATENNTSANSIPSNVTNGKAQAPPSAPPMPTSPAAAGVSNSLQSATAQIHYEPVSASEMEIANAAASMPSGQTLVRPTGSFDTAQSGIDSQKQANPSAGSIETRSSSELHIDLHVYSNNASERFVLINMRRYTEGQQLPNGATVEQITPQGVVVYQNGTRYQLER